jgi:2-phosphosulfolactate phosphatase
MLARAGYLLKNRNLRPDMKHPLRIVRKSLLAGAQETEGIAVIIDVLRAFTSAAFMMHLGAREIILLAETAAATRLKHERGCLAVGEVDGKKPSGFDLGNSPSRILAAGRERFAGRTVAMRTTAGTTGAVAATNRSDLVILGSYVTAAAIAHYIRGLSPAPEVVSLVAMGDDGLGITPDDEACADYIEHLLTGQPYDHMAALQRIIEHECTQRFLRGDQDRFPPADPAYCLQRNLFDFVMIATVADGQLLARPFQVVKAGAA